MSGTQCGWTCWLHCGQSGWRFLWRRGSKDFRRDLLVRARWPTYASVHHVVSPWVVERWLEHFLLR
jgi:hypothetical protein